MKSIVAKKRNCIGFTVVLCLFALLLTACGERNAEQSVASPAPAVTAAPAPEPTPAPTPEPIVVLTAEPTVEPTSVPVVISAVDAVAPDPTDAPDAPQGRYVFQPKICSVYMEEVFGRDMCEAWSNLVDAVMAGENTFACKDQHTYDWVMGQFPDRCFPVLTELIDYAYDREHSVIDGVASFTWLVPPEEAAARIAEFAEQIEGILNEAFEEDYSDLEKALSLYIYFSEHYEYDYDTYWKMYEKYVDYTSCYRFFKTGIGICHEISSAYSYLLAQAGVEATIMMGSDHQWSYVRINGQDYHIDPTFVLNDKGSLSYFMMTDEQREANGYGKAEYTITSNYAQDHPHPDYVADDDTFRPLWDKDFDSFSHETHTIRCWTQSGYYGEWTEYLFDYAGY